MRDSQKRWPLVRKTLKFNYSESHQFSWWEKEIEKYCCYKQVHWQRIILMMRSIWTQILLHLCILCNESLSEAIMMKSKNICWGIWPWKDFDRCRISTIFFFVFIIIFWCSVWKTIEGNREKLWKMLKNSWVNNWLIRERLK